MFHTLLVLINLIMCAKTYDHTMPRGASVGKGSLYNPLADFTCFDGSVTIPFSYVNDDYCDCHDGSDEPGTSACPNGIFHCINNGYFSKNIPSSRVNDGICDCCDASDEFDTGNCTDTCAILRSEARKQAEKMAELIVKGNQLMLELSIVGKQIKKEKKERITALELEKEEAEHLKLEVEKIKEEAEKKESQALNVYRMLEEDKEKEKTEKERLDAEQEITNAFMHLDVNSDGRLDSNELLTILLLNSSKEIEGSIGELENFLTSKDGVLQEDFKETVWPKIKSFYLINEEKLGQNQQTVDEDDNAGQSESFLNEIRNENSFSTESSSGIEEELVGRENAVEEGSEDWNKSEEHGVPNEDEEVTMKYDDQTRTLIEEAKKARTDYENAERAVQDLDREVSHLRDFLAKDYGASDEFVALDGQCFSYTDSEYTYKLCPFDQVVQMAKSGGSETRLGSWKAWATTGEYSSMIYDKGQSCWNGPQRSTKVMVSCGLENEVVSASEPSRCEYMLDFKTPSACRLQEVDTETHDEL